MAGSRVTVQDLVSGIDAVYPYAQAEPWDRVGLLLGDAQASVTGVVCALEPRLETLDFAHEKGANVIVSHHPAFVESPSTFTEQGSYAGRVVQKASRLGISLINAHTNLDVSTDARRTIGDHLGLIGYHEAKEVSDSKEPESLSRYASQWQTTVPRSLAEFARFVQHKYGACPRVYGDKQKPIVSVMTSTGAGGCHCGDAALNQADVLITGEAKYHDALAALECGVAVIELGHDVSEWPLVALLKDAILAQTFLSPERIFDAPNTPVWWTETGEIHV